MNVWRKFLPILLILFFAACGSDSGSVQQEYMIDEATGLPLNPEALPDGDFVIEGNISSMNLTPQSSPEFVIKVPSGRTFRVRAQALPDILYDDGEAVGVVGFVQDMPVRAVISQATGGAETGNTNQLVTEDLIVLK